MKELIVERVEPVTLVGAGVLGPDDLEVALALAPVLVAADGGAAHALAAGHRPVAVIGDLDSLAAEVQADLSPGSLHHVTEQTSTDFDKALRMIGAPVVLGVGFLGGRIDHQLAGFNTLVQPHPSPCVLLGPQEVVFHLRGEIALPLTAGEVVSLFPMQQVTGWSEGLAWPIEGLQLDPMARIGTSNRATGPVRLRADGPGMLVILPRARLADVVAALRAQG
ncbi:thiamine diphosphokinase [Phaeobacter piscinae]|uniref:Thiamine diphosphokinase n=1 Tax=Phaeobacter piscinae TaxID=1580596 RepID=A0ABN5DFX3_9RHOB|nr:thiamine diphosphokinase [Phaeobacter piscinae]ATG36304.1 thiamine pyrophosphokinase-like protein [Phaeobacter piscinae]ATG40244.1 thiamine pyrophosphokinase-like protein [Phaeobacter piscinae]AUQ86825.1 thiamine pyrophosphokinase-like protein [Phaeobacter piscinae]AUR24708.1 thiamine pyrophosphokinase-like protein [Phaeobacter piscinae]